MILPLNCLNQSLPSKKIPTIIRYGHRGDFLYVKLKTVIRPL